MHPYLLEKLAEAMTLQAEHEAGYRRGPQTLRFAERLRVRAERRRGERERRHGRRVPRE